MKKFFKSLESQTIQRTKNAKRKKKAKKQQQQSNLLEDEVKKLAAVESISFRFAVELEAEKK